MSWNMTILVRLRAAMRSSQAQEAKARMSELVKWVQLEPLDITSHGKIVAVVLSREAFDRLSPHQEALLEFMRRSPLYDADDEVFERDGSLTREVGL